MQQRRAARSTGLTVVFLVVTSVYAWGTCPQLSEQAQRTEDPAQLRQLYDDATHRMDCDATSRAELGKRVALASLNAARLHIQQGATTQAETVLQESLRYARLWPSLVMLGDLRYERKEYGDAARWYSEALEAVHAPQSPTSPPTADTLARLNKRFEMSRLLAKNYVRMPTARSMRNFAAQSQAIPITFAYNSTEFDEKGQQAASDLLRWLQEVQPPAIMLIGHTDPRGSDEYNLSLSLRRAEAVKTYLAQGYQGQVITEGRGKREPYQPDDPLKYTEDELYRLHRRVELRQAP